MKNLYFLTTILLSFGNLAAQTITFTDPTLKSKLLLSATNNSIVTNLAGNYIDIDINGDNEIQVSEAMNVLQLDLNYENTWGLPKLTSLGGLENFTNLELVHARDNNLTTFDFPSLVNLKEIIIINNQLSQINLLSNTNIEFVNINGNQLTAIDLSGLTKMFWFEARNNLFTTLTFSNLTDLQQCFVDENDLTSITFSNLPNLWQLVLNNNQLSSLDLSPVPTITYLSIGSNQFSTIDVNVLPNLWYFDCYFNQLTSLDVSNCSIISISCENNQLISLNLEGQTNLQQVFCQNNLLTELDLSGFGQLDWVDCKFNQLQTIDLTGTFLLKDFYGSDNQLTSVNFNDCHVLEDFELQNNLLETLFLKNGSTMAQFDINFLNNPTLEYICADTNEIDQLTNYVNNGGMPLCLVNTFCTFVPGGEYYTINGNQKFDSDGNGCDAGDIILPMFKYTVSDGTISETIISDQSGNFSFGVNEGMYTITPMVENSAYFSVSPASMTVNFPAEPSPFSQNFCVTATDPVIELSVVMIPLTPARPGFNTDYKLIVKNNGSFNQSGTVSLAYSDDILDLVAANPSLTSETSNNFHWTFSDIPPFESLEFYLTLNVNSPMETPAVNGGDVLNYAASVSLYDGDIRPGNNIFGLKQTVVNSMDPNDKTCLEGDTVGPEMVGEYVHYVIRFENTGTFPAQNIVVKDIIDLSKFDIATLIPLSGSHPFETRITSGSKVEFIFENIQLPFDDANNDGYVAFKIKTKPTLVVGNTFSNSASIYFDYNFPIITNTATTTITALSNPDFEFSDYFTLYPNPANTELNIKANNSIEVKSINIYNLLGQLVLAIPNAKNVSSIDVSDLKSGNYFIKINSEKGSSIGKFIKQ